MNHFILREFMLSLFYTRESDIRSQSKAFGCITLEIRIATAWNSPRSLDIIGQYYTSCRIIVIDLSWYWCFRIHGVINSNHARIT